jgi:hypothetical protein
MEDRRQMKDGRSQKTKGIEVGSWNVECGKKRMWNKLKSECGMGKAEMR